MVKVSVFIELGSLTLYQCIQIDPSFFLPLPFVNALIAFPPRRFSLESTRAKRKAKGEWNLADVCDDKFDAVFVCAQHIDKYKDSKRPHESQITINFHRSLLCVCCFLILSVISEAFHLQCVYDTLGRIKSHFHHTLHFTFWYSFGRKQKVNEDREKNRGKSSKAQSINKNETLHKSRPFIFSNILLIVSFYLLFGAFLLCCDKNMAFLFHLLYEPRTNTITKIVECFTSADASSVPG